ncbi:tetratricopeptide repeat protein [Roseivirga sp.]|uniref:tetratricopeptide repeat protein n=1 Tax=Roseivirga sp. TaxID=1964215 RepID=UPI003B8CD442
MKRIIVSLLFLTGSLSAQTSRLDSLYRLAEQKRSSLKLETINSLIKQQMDVNPYKADSLANIYNDFANSSSASKEKAQFNVNWATALLRMKNPYLARTKSLKAIEQLEGSKIYSLKGLANLVYGQTFQAERKYDSTTIYYVKALELYTQAEDIDGQGLANDRLGVNYSMQQKYAEALNYYKGAIQLRKQAEDTMSVHFSYGNIGLLYKKIGEYDLALHYYLKSLEIKEHLGYKVSIGKVLNNIGNLYQETGDYDLAIDALEQSIEMKKELFDTLGWSFSLDNIGAVKQSQGDYGEAISYHLESLELRRNMKVQTRDYITLANIGRCYRLIGNRREAKRYFLESLTAAKEANVLRSTARAYNHLSDLSREQFDYQSSLDYGLKSLKIAEELGTRDALFEAHQALNQTYRSMGNLKMAFYHLDEYLMYEREMFDAQKQIELNKIRVRYEFNQKEQELLASQKELERVALQSGLIKSRQVSLLISIVILTLLIVFLWLWFKSKMSRVKVEKKLLEQEKINSNKDLEIKDLKLLHYTNQLKHQKELVEGYKVQLVDSERNGRDREEQQLSQMAVSVEGRAGQNLSWEDFRLKFDEVHQQFVSNLLNTFGSLSPNELDLLILLKINLSYKDIAQILNVSYDSVRKSVHRLYRKLNFASPEEMRVFILQK